MADMIIKDVKKRINTKKWQDGFIPNPLTYINGDRWEDEMDGGNPVSANEKWAIEQVENARRGQRKK